MDGALIEINAPRGLGDAIYLRAVVLHLIGKGEKVKVYTLWPDVFRDLPIEVGDVNAIPDFDNLHHVTACLYCQAPAIQLLDKFTLACLQAGIAEPVEFKIDWRCRNTKLVDDVRSRAGGRPIMVYQPLKKAKNALQKMARPDAGPVHRFVANSADHFRVKVGHPAFTDDSPELGCELDLYGKLSVGDVFDVVSGCDTVFGESCFVPVLAEAMDKPLVCMFARRAMESKNKALRGASPARLFKKPHLVRAVYDDDE